MKSPVYNYQTQKWEDSAELRLAQLRDDLALIESAKGEDYLRFIGCTKSKSAMVVQIRESIAAMHNRIF